MYSFSSNTTLNMYIYMQIYIYIFRSCEGTSHFGSGTLGLFKPIAERNIIMYSIKLYRQLEAKGYDIGVFLIFIDCC